MDVNLLMIINEKNYFEAMVTVQSILEYRKKEKYRLTVLTSDLKRRKKEAIEKILSGVSECKISYLKEAVDEDAIWDLQFDKLNLTGEKTVFVQSKVFFRKNISWLFEEKESAIVASLVTPHYGKDYNNKKVDLGLIVINTTKIEKKNLKLKDMVLTYGYELFDAEEYYNIHPMVSLKEYERYTNKHVEDFSLMEMNAKAIRMYSSLESRFRGMRVVDKEWRRYWIEIHEKANLINLNKKVKFIEKKADHTGTRVCIWNIPVVQKKYSNQNYEIRVLGIPVVKYYDDAFYKKKKILGIVFDKNFSFSKVDDLIIERINLVVASFEQANKRILESTSNYERVVLDGKELEKQVKELSFLQLFNDLQDEKISAKDEINLKTK